MPWFGSIHSRALGLLLAFMFLSCGARTHELDLSNYDLAQDQRKIAEYYTQEAARLREKSEAMLTRAAIYEQLFGRNSDWVAGARLLAQSYEEEAREHERMASKHVGAGRH